MNLMNKFYWELIATMQISHFVFHAHHAVMSTSYFTLHYPYCHIVSYT